MTLILVVLLLLILFGGGWGWHSGYVGAGNPIGIVLLVVLVIVVLGLVAPFAGYRWY